MQSFFIDEIEFLAIPNETYFLVIQLLTIDLRATLRLLSCFRSTHSGGYASGSDGGGTYDRRYSDGRSARGGGGGGFNHGYRGKFDGGYGRGGRVGGRGGGYGGRF